MLGHLLAWQQRRDLATIPPDGMTESMICFHQSVIKKCYYHRHIVSLVERFRQNVLPERVAEVYVLYTRGNEVRLEVVLVSVGEPD